MITIYGVCNISMSKVANAIRKFQTTGILRDSQVLRRPIINRTVILLPSVACLKRNRSVLMVSDVIVFVFDYVKNCETVKDLRILNSLTSIIDATVNALRMRDSKHVPIVIETSDIAATMLRATKVSSVSLIMTFLYKIPDADKRAAMHKRLFTYIKNNNKQGMLDLLVRRKSAVARKLRTHIEGGGIDSLLEAVKDMRSGATKVDRGLPEFDLNYLTKMMK